MCVCAFAAVKDFHSRSWRLMRRSFEGRLALPSRTSLVSGKEGVVGGGGQEGRG